jgi:flavin-dependent dehydrogenase
VPRFAAGGTGLSDAGTLLVGGAAGLISAPTSFAPDWTLALRSARAASQAILRAGASPAPAETVLGEYRRTLVRTGVEREQRAVEAAERRFKWNPRVHRQYTRFLEALLHGMMSQPGSPKQRVRDTVRDARRAAGVRWTDLLRDALGGGS